MRGLLSILISLILIPLILIYSIVTYPFYRNRLADLSILLEIDEETCSELLDLCEKMGLSPNGAGKIIRANYLQINLNANQHPIESRNPIRAQIIAQIHMQQKMGLG